MQKIFIALLMGFALVSFAYAQTEPKVQGPIEELGGCSSKEECKAYCDEPSHVQACVSYAVKAGFMTEEQAQKALKFANQTGPGGCMGSACRTYCSAQEHFEECQAFAEKNGLTGPRGKAPKERIEEPSIDETKAEALIAEKGGPGGCTNMNECRAYCEDSSHMDACMAYAKENNLMSQEEIDRAQKFVTKEGPGGCKGIACKNYCEDSAHAEECFAFAEKEGLVSKEESERNRALLSQPGPGGCIGIACREYCEDPSHHQECYAFAKQNSFVEEHGGGPQEGNEQGPMEGRFAPPPTNMQCSTPEECKALYEKYRNESGSSEMPANSGTNMPREEYQYSEPGERPQGAPMSPEEYKKYEQYRTEYPQNSQQPMPTGSYPERPEYQMTPEQQKMYEQYQRGEYKPPEGGTTPHPSADMNQYPPMPSGSNGSYQGTYPSSGGYQGGSGSYPPPPPPSDGGSTPPPPPPSSFNPVSFTASAFSAILNFFGF